MSLPQMLCNENLLNECDVVRMLNDGHYWVEYEPIIDMKTGTIFGYEALARFVLNERRIPPMPVFMVAHQNPELFFRLESELKAMQLFHRPKNAMLFINLDPHNFSDEAKLSFWRELFLGAKNLCLEITENTDDMQTAFLSHCLDEIQTIGFPIAQDDIGNDEKPFCFDLTSRADFLKFDRTWLLKIKRCPDYQEILKGFLAFAKAQGKKSVLEGIESEGDFMLARALEVDYVQGYLFKHLNHHSC
ncbi:EAL domain-containing protein [Sulfurospirillum barnesii]|uniref:EAL domain-containing protein n=1 Tax=Sulfurospirillum barnesii (strain ATCC 700032 / DSM 10660 / SES-3) TaxID=760154 RepID=I3XZP3_SULBS|nr:EAL domain-containing protein [Sulfurospirillum barnesii]AFL69417.1 EAL domain-containing protein [Sulfurospirillum barnesii SES-3]